MTSLSGKKKNTKKNVTHLCRRPMKHVYNCAYKSVKMTTYYKNIDKNKVITI